MTPAAPLSCSEFTVIYGHIVIVTRVESMVAAPIDDVFARLVDLPNWNAWLDPECGSDGCRFTSDGPVGLGTTYEDDIKNGLVLPGELVEFDAPNRVVFLNRLTVDGELVLQSRLAYSLTTASPDSTLVEHDFTAEFFGAMTDREAEMRELMPQERARIGESLTRSFASAT
jgi:uncharacterized protein YndB with AHSA1/START domain